ncbi:MAG: zinc-ribbon domain-containing protein [Polymorphobacter sp.]
MIVTCPNCAARYKLSDAVLAQRARLKCAACEHRWVPEAAPAASAPSPRRKPVTEADEEAAFALVQEQIRARWQDAATPVTPTAPVQLDEAPEPADEAAEPDTDDTPPSPSVSPLARTAIAVISGAALAVAAVGLWSNQLDLAKVPGAGPLLARLSPPSALQVSVAGATTILPSGGRVLDVSGVIRNPGKRAASVPALSARLAGPGGTALRWTIPAPVTMLPAGQEVVFTSTITGVPADATTLGVSPSS